MNMPDEGVPQIRLSRRGLLLVGIPLVAALTGCTPIGTSNTRPSAGERTTPMYPIPSPSVATSQPITVKRGDITLAGTLETPPIAPGHQVPLAILMHGFTGTQDEPVLQATARALTAVGIAAIRFDFDGNGASSGQHVDMTIPSEIADGEAIVDYARALPFVSTIGLAGHSMGGVVAAMLAGQLGDKVAALALFAPAVGLVSAAREGTFFGNRYDPANPPASVSAFGFQLGRNFLLTAASLPVKSTAARFTGPVDLIQGSADALVSVASIQQFATVYRHAQVQILDGQDHDFFADPDQVGSDAAAFLASNL